MDQRLGSASCSLDKHAIGWRRPYRCLMMANIYIYRRATVAWCSFRRTVRCSEKSNRVASLCRKWFSVVLVILLGWARQQMGRMLWVLLRILLCILNILFAWAVQEFVGAWFRLGGLLLARWMVDASLFILAAKPRGAILRWSLRLLERIWCCSSNPSVPVIKILLFYCYINSVNRLLVSTMLNSLLLLDE